MNFEDAHLHLSRKSWSQSRKHSHCAQRAPPARVIPFEQKGLLIVGLTKEV